ncbi:MarR family winged helix-turn-helix transcriptional regulator [Chengkuizengella axinellae]|uniref:MarR family winged helix-turn-helix transcriptional regulator n=1 Tax=Chengkuizengella axinellae TaxID=3064388 RepID=A0ABT9J1Z6_9BACL|nr:MarR family winged helix-turn-helix transcriptional regulator [Chengkuizengella sp. 2205SS18-9]MDP5275518.1 MarR family winged helix-turn-helix transcriptional regulator [Chengkuizengella sp. 2205SS18-9]
MDQFRNSMLILARKFGILNEQSCMSCCGKELSLVQSHILYEVDRQNQPSMQDVAGALSIDITTFSRQIKNLSDKKMVKKTPDPKDNRIHILSLTEKGKEIQDKIDQEVNIYLEQVFAELSEFERDTIIRSIELLNGKMSKTGICCIPAK